LEGWRKPTCWMWANGSFDWSEVKRIQMEGASGWRRTWNCHYTALRQYFYWNLCLLFDSDMSQRSICKTSRTWDRHVGDTGLGTLFLTRVRVTVFHCRPHHQNNTKNNSHRLSFFFSGVKAYICFSSHTSGIRQDPICGCCWCEGDFKDGANVFGRSHLCNYCNF
jgi:hypothetical protein